MPASAPPTPVGEQPHRVEIEAHGACGVGAVADDAHDEPDARVAEGPPQHDRQRRADQEQHIDVERRLDLRDIGPAAEGNRRQVWRLRLDERLAEEEGEARAEQHQRDADSDVVNPRKLADPAVEQRRSRAPAQAAANTPSHGELVSPRPHRRSWRRRRACLRGPD